MDWTAMTRGKIVDLAMASGKVRGHDDATNKIKEARLSEGLLGHVMVSTKNPRTAIVWMSAAYHS